MVIKWNGRVILVFTAGLAEANYVCEYTVYTYIYINNYIIREKSVTKCGTM